MSIWMLIYSKWIFLVLLFSFSLGSFFMDPDRLIFSLFPDYFSNFLKILSWTLVSRILVLKIREFAFKAGHSCIFSIPERVVVVFVVFGKSEPVPEPLNFLCKNFWNIFPSVYNFSNFVKIPGSSKFCSDYVIFT